MVWKTSIKTGNFYNKQKKVKEIRDEVIQNLHKVDTSNTNKKPRRNSKTALQQEKNLIGVY